MLESDFVELQIYANKYQLPSRRNELLLAQIAQYIAMTMGGAKRCQLQDYMPYREAETEALTDDEIEEMTPEEIRKLHNFEVST